MLGFDQLTVSVQLAEREVELHEDRFILLDAVGVLVKLFFQNVLELLSADVQLSAQAAGIFPSFKRPSVANN